MTELILASKSKARCALLENAGLVFAAIGSNVDERAAEAPLLEAGAAPEDIAAVLAEAKALDVSERHPEALVIGGDQVLGFEGERYTKPDDMAAARRQLLKLQGATHQLHSALVIAQGGETLWRHLSTAQMTIRPLEPADVGRYLAEVGERALSSVGCYQLEGPGVQLFERIDGDYFTVLGLPLLPLLARLREEGIGL